MPQNRSKDLPLKRFFLGVTVELHSAMTPHSVKGPTPDGGFGDKPQLG